MITASGLARLLACLGSAVLPRFENHNEWADLGNEEHDDLSDLANLPDELAALVPPGARSEVKLAFDVATGVGRIIGEGAGRSYGEIGPTEAAGSTDVLGVQGDAVVIVDWKTGFADVEPAASNAQLWFYALAACRALGKDRAIVRIVYTKTGRVDEAEIDALDLASFANRLAALHPRIAAAKERKARGEMVETREGAWCKHCPSKSVCPSKVGLLAQVASGGLAVIGDTEMTPARAAAAYEQLVRFEGMVKDARKRLETYVDEQGPLDLGNGRMYGRYQRKGNEKIDGAVAVRAIREVLGAELAAEFEATAIVPTTSKAAIDRAAKAVTGSTTTKPTALARAVLAKTRELGGVTSSPTYPIGEFVRGKDEPASRPEIDTDAVDQLLRDAG